MSRELNELKSSLRVAAASVTNNEIAAQEPTFSSSEVAVQAILECLRNKEFLVAIRCIRECRWGKKKFCIEVSK